MEPRMLVSTNVEWVKKYQVGRIMETQVGVTTHYLQTVYFSHQQALNDKWQYTQRETGFFGIQFEPAEV